MDNQARQLLFQLIQDYGVDVANNPQRLNALFKDYACGQFKREIFVCVQAAREGVVTALQNNKHLPYEALAARLTQQLHDDIGMDLQAAKWAVGSWIVVLGLTDKFSPAKSTDEKKLDLLKTLKARRETVNTSENKNKSIQTPTPIIKTLIANRYMDNGDGTITDTKTQLQWLRFSLGQTWNGTTVLGEAARYKWQEGLTAAQTFNQNGGFAGFSDWQVPTIDELKTIVENGKKPTIHHEAFPATPASLYWSASTAPNASNSAWSVYFYGGSVYWYGKGCHYYVRLVRRVS